MNTVHASIGKQPYKTEIHTATNSIIGDEPLELGGQDLGFSPADLITASLAACTCATLRMYADRKAWNLTDVKVKVTFERDAVKNTSHFVRTVELVGELDETQRQRLLTIANSCFIHKTLTNPIEVTTELATL
ncbi:putative redox protein [Filimonas zeae]|uniref:Osmotically inducible protein C n=1 Tax=Filimonas zeae TaxID=1737353 RepID=A0A917MRM9_9BACT|nr:OsmC family protein [Filimonas zeae]MDR6337768.1 putative redox protein [Filimonas zeae]GGH60169.1 osmotically inducible protein C [Filimonas zeae]